MNKHKQYDLMIASNMLGRKTMKIKTIYFIIIFSLLTVFSCSDSDDANRDPGCPDYFDYSHHSYSNNQLTITLDHFNEPDIVCPAVYVELFLVFKARKSS